MRRKLTSIAAGGAIALVALSLGSLRQATPVRATGSFDLSIYLTHSPEPVVYPNTAVFTITLQMNGDSQLASTSGDALGVRVLFPPSWNIDSDTGSDSNMTCSYDPSFSTPGPNKQVAYLCGTWQGSGSTTAVLSKCQSVSFTITAHPNDPSTWGGGGSHAAQAQLQDANNENTNPNVQVTDGVYVVPNSSVTATPGPRNNPGDPPPSPPTGCTASGGSPSPSAAPSTSPSTGSSPSPSPTPSAGGSPSPSATPSTSVETPTPSQSTGSTPSAGASASPTGGNEPASLAQTGGGILPPGGPIGALLGVLMIGAIAALATGKVRKPQS